MTQNQKLNKKVDCANRIYKRKIYPKSDSKTLSDEKYLLLIKKKKQKYAAKTARIHAFRKYISQSCTHA